MDKTVLKAIISDIENYTQKGFYFEHTKCFLCKKNTYVNKITIANKSGEDTFYMFVCENCVREIIEKIRQLMIHK